MCVRPAQFREAASAALVVATLCDPVLLLSCRYFRHLIVFFGAITTLDRGACVVQRVLRF